MTNRAWWAATWWWALSESQRESLVRGLVAEWNRPDAFSEHMETVSKWIDGHESEKLTQAEVDRIHDEILGFSKSRVSRDVEFYERVISEAQEELEAAQRELQAVEDFQLRLRKQSLDELTSLTESLELYDRPETGEGDD